MALSLARLKSFFGNTASTAAGFGIGIAAGPALEPLLQELRNETWSLHPDRPLDAFIGAQGVAQGQVDPDTAKTWAAHGGIGPDVWDAMVSIANVGPGLGYAYEAWRRGFLTQAEFDTALKRTGLEEQWNIAMEKLKDVLLEPAEIAKAIHRNIMRGDGLLLVEPSTVPGKVPMVPQSSIDPVTEAEGSGMTQERLRILVGNAGLPPGVVQGLQLLNRGSITEDDFSRLVGESNMRQEWGEVLLDLRRRLLTPHEYEEAALRGVITQAAADAGAALSGMEQADAELLFEIMGRPLAVHQITTGLARGGTYGGTYDDIPEPYRDAVRRSNIRPEYARLAYANRYTIPSYFILRAILQAGGMTEAEFADYGKQLGWPPDLAEQAASALASTSTSSTTTTHLTKAQNQVWTALHKSYVSGKTPASLATTDLQQIGVPADQVAQILKTWDTEKALIRRELTATQIKKATDEPYKTPAEKLAALQGLGYSQTDAQAFLDE